MITISVSIILTIFLSLLIFFVCWAGIVILMWGDDRAFIVGSIFSASIVLLLNLWYFGIIRFVY